MNFGVLGLMELGVWSGVLLWGLIKLEVWSDELRSLLNVGVMQGCESFKDLVLWT